MQTRLPLSSDKATSLSCIVLFAALGAPSAFADTVVIVDVASERKIEGVGELDRKKYFAICHQGSNLDVQCRTPERYRQLVKRSQVSLGRRLGLVKYYTKSEPDSVVEDPSRPGHVDLERFRAWTKANPTKPQNRLLRKDFGANMDVACHGHKEAFPDFMGRYVSSRITDQKVADHERLPKNIDAAAEYSAAVLKHVYDNFTRPRYYEPINEPHWAHPSEKHFVDWHLKTRAAVKKLTPDVLVGGPCLPVGYFYSEQYKGFNGLKKFIDDTKASLDFYSFHVYDYLREENGDFGGRITSGLPLESVLDLSANYMHNTHDKQLKLVFSEHGGYGADELAESIAKERFSETGFALEMKKRSITDYNMVRSLVGNTLVFMDHPHTVLKAVPFILLESVNWDPTYKSVLFTPENYEKKGKWLPSQHILFYDFFRGLAGRRLKAFCPDPDIQTRAFMDRRRVYLVLNNLANKAEDLKLRMTAAKSYEVRRLGRNSDFTPYLREEKLESLEGLRIEPYESLMITAIYDTEQRVRRRFDETVCYGNRLTTPVERSTYFRVDVPKVARLDYAVLRVGISRPGGSGKDIRIKFNKQWLDVPVEDCAERIDDNGKHGYASTKIVWVPKKLVRKSNRITVAFPDKGPGKVGSVVLRAGLKAS